MHYFQRKRFMDVSGVIPVTSEVTLNHCLERFPFKVRPRKRPRVEQHFPNVLGKGVAVPDTEMTELVAAQE